MIPPVYPTAVDQTPGTCQNVFSSPQKQPSANTAVASPAGNGGTIRLPVTTWVSGTSNG